MISLTKHKVSHTLCLFVIVLWIANCSALRRQCFCFKEVQRSKKKILNIHHSLQGHWEWCSAARQFRLIQRKGPGLAKK